MGDKIALQKLKQQQQQEIKQLTLFRSPFKTLKYFFLELSAIARSALTYIFSHKILSTLALGAISSTILAFWLTPHDSPTYVQYMQPFKQEAEIAAYWIFLGVLSSIGLGTGLHTFVLYLGPFIAEATMAAEECGSLAFDVYGPNAFLCRPDLPVIPVTFFGILRKVQFACLCWGFGTAIGELPPYFVARAARLAGENIEDLEEGNVSGIVKKFKSYFNFLLGRFAFISILLLASIPNPLFDLAGLTCGYSLIPFWTFFGATVLGKAFFKAHLQSLVVISIFRQQQIDLFLKFVENVGNFISQQLNNLPENKFSNFVQSVSVKDKIAEYLASEKAKFHPDNLGNHNTVAQKSLLKYAWDIILGVMLLGFVISIINSSAQSRLAVTHEKELSKLSSANSRKSQ